MGKVKSFVKNNIILIIIFLLFIITRLLNFTDTIRYESSQWILQVMQFITIKWQIFHLIPHFPLAVILYKVWALAIWNTIIWVKAMHLLLNVITFFLTYKTAILFYNDKKVANWSILLYTISFYAYAWNTMWIDQDLAINPLLFLLTLYLYKKYSDFSLKGISLTVLSCSLLTISRPILWVIVMWIICLDMISNYIVKNKKNIKFSWIVCEVFRFLKLFIPYLIIWWLLCYLMLKLFPSPVLKALNTYKNLFTWNWWYEWVTLLTRFSFLWQVFLYTSPLIICILPLFRNFKKHKTLLIASIIMVLYMFMWLSWWDPARRMMPILPIFSILLWVVCSQYINKKNWWLIFAIALWLCSFNYLYLDYSLLPYNVNDYLSSPLNKVFILTTTIFSPIYLNSELVFWIVWITLILVFLALLQKNRITKYIFISFSLWINLFLVTTHIFQIKQPHITTIWKEMYEFCVKNCDWDKKIYSDQLTKDTIMLWLWDKNIWSYFNLHPDNDTISATEYLLSNPINLKGINLFTQGLELEDFVDTIKSDWSGFVFMTKYFGNNEEINVLSEKCETIKKFSWDIDEIYWIVYLCSF